MLRVAPRRRELVEPRAGGEQRLLRRRELARLGATAERRVVERERELARGLVLVAEHALDVRAKLIRAQGETRAIGRRDGRARAEQRRGGECKRAAATHRRARGGKKPACSASRRAPPTPTRAGPRAARP